MEVTNIRAKVPNSFSKRMKLLCNTPVEHDKLKNDNYFVNESYLFTQISSIVKICTTTAREPSIYIILLLIFSNNNKSSLQQS